MPVGGNELDLLDYLSNQKSEIQTIVKDQARSGPVKVGMSACAKKVKDLETSIDEDARQKRIEFRTNTQMQLIYPGNGLPDDEYWASVEKLLNCVTTFSLEKNGWRFESLSRFEIKFARFAPIRPGSYIAPPPKYESEQSLLNIRNYNDPNCFFYCFTAAYHMFTGKPLAGPKTSWRVKKSPELYGPGNRNAHQPLGENKMPLPMSEIGIFENENDVQVNIFR